MNKEFKGIYIAGKITGLSDYKDRFNEAEAALSKIGFTCMNPAILPEGFPWAAYMPICYTMIDACDYVYMLRNWRDSKGATLEHDYAKAKGKKIIYGYIEGTDQK